MGAKGPDHGSAAVLKVIEGERDNDVGKVVRDQGSPIQSW